MTSINWASILKIDIGGVLLGRKNNKNQLVGYEDSIKKSNELSIAKMNQGLTLNQMQLFSYAIFSTQKDGKTEFRKHEFEKRFNIDQLRPDDAMDDAYRLLDLKIEIRDSARERGRGHNVFTDYNYDKGRFSFKWNETFIPHILELKEKYIITDLTITSKFRSSFSWALYDYLKAHYSHWHKELTKDELMELFCVKNISSYQRNTSVFKNKVLDVAIKEINEHTEFEVWYTEIKNGRAITGFMLHWSTGKTLAGATEKQIQLLVEIHDEVEENLIDYLQIKNSELARKCIITIKIMEGSIKNGLSVVNADKNIKESLEAYRTLEQLLESDGKERDTSVYFNWLKESGNEKGFVTRNFKNDDKNN